MKRYIVLSLLITISIFLRPHVGAHGTAYFEFNPDNSQSILLTQVTSPTEIFLPQNEHIGGIDVWADNNGSAGSLTVELRTGAGTLLISKTVTIPHINPVSGGQRIHIDFPVQQAVTHNAPYRLVFITPLPELRLYYGDRVIFVEHNAPQGSAYLNGAAEINGEEREFSFKFALYEYTESKAPIIIDHGATVLGPTQARIDFHANEYIDYKVVYGVSGGGPMQDTGYTSDYSYCGVVACSIVLSTSPDMLYQYTLWIKDVWGNESSATGTFVSNPSGQTPTPIPTVTSTPTPTGSTSPTPTPDQVPPVISQLRVVNIQPTAVTVAWTTNEAANSYVVIQSLPNLITVGTNNDNTLELEHALGVSNLTSDTFYQARVISNDASGNQATATINFAAPAGTPAPSPTSSITPLPSPTIQQSGNGDATIQWQPSGSSGEYRVDIFDEQHNLIESRTITGNTSITARVPQNHHIVVYEKKDDVYQKVAVTTAPPRAESRSPYLIPALVIGGILIGVLGFLLVYLRRKKKTPPPQTSQNSQTNTPGL